MVSGSTALPACCTLTTALERKWQMGPENFEILTT
jgi:hypothetical protein